MIIFLAMYTHPKTLHTVQYLEERGPIPVLLSNIQPSKAERYWEDREPVPHCQFCCPTHSHPKTQLTTGRTENLYHIASFAVQHTPMHQNDQSSQRPSALSTVVFWRMEYHYQTTIPLPILHPSEPAHCIVLKGQNTQTPLTFPSSKRKVDEPLK